MGDLAKNPTEAPSGALTLEESKFLVGLCRAGKLYEVEDWIRAGRSLEVAPSVRKAPLEVAIETGFHSLIVCLALNGRQLEVKNRALEVAVDKRRLDWVELLVGHGAEVGAVPFVDVLRSTESRCASP